MPTQFEKVGEHLKVVVPLTVIPQTHTSSPTITASAISKNAGIVLFGNFRSEYLLPDGDRLIIFANHNKDNAQLILLTRDAKKLQALPGDRPSSIVANAISQINRYCIRSKYYASAPTPAQKDKYMAAQKAIISLKRLLVEERRLAPKDWSDQEKLRRKVIRIIEGCRDENRLIANNPVVSEGELGVILYNAAKSTQHYQFNRRKAVCRMDQLDFSEFNEATTLSDKKPCFIWDSELHLGTNEEAFKDTLRVICNLYNLDTGVQLSEEANRFKRVGRFFQKIWSNGRDFISYLAHPVKPSQPSKTYNLAGGISLTKTEPYYTLKGLKQEGYLIAPEKTNFFEEEERFYPLPTGDDLLTLTQISAVHLYLHERVSLQFKAFLSRLPTFVVYLYRSIANFIRHDYHDFNQHIHGNHPQPSLNRKDKEKVQDIKESLTQEYLKTIKDVLDNKGLLATGETLEEFIRARIQNDNYIMAREKHPPSPPAYDNPLHRSLGVVRHIGAFFVDASEKNPIIGSLALAAYVFGAGAIVAPDKLAAILTKLHLKGLISAIKPTQALGKWMSHGTSSEAIAAASTYWQGIIVAGSFDQFFIEAVEVLKDNPAEVAIVTAMAIGLGYGLSEAIPSVAAEMGSFPWINYAFLGLKAGLAIHDTVSNPGEDWLLGTIKWVLKGIQTFTKIVLGPLIEAYYYEGGFGSGLRKSGRLLLRTVRQVFAAISDFILAVLTIPLLEFSAMFIHVPFRGITNLLSKTLATIGHWQPIGEVILDFAPQDNFENYFQGFRPSLLYGFYNPLGNYSNNGFLNFLANTAMLIVSPPIQILKHLILPLLDISSLIGRALLTLAHPVYKLFIYSTGTALLTAGYFWDNSVGQAFQLAARTVTLTANWLDNQFGDLKQYSLSIIQIIRLFLHDWAFEEEDILLHTENQDMDYLLSHPDAVEHLPHDYSNTLEKKDSTSCLLEALIGDKLPALKRKANSCSNTPFTSKSSSLRSSWDEEEVLNYRTPGNHRATYGDSQNQGEPISCTM